jgi:CheY-like chemotaxis protein
VKVLVAEPDAETRELATRALRRAGHSVSQAIDGRGAIQGGRSKNRTWFSSATICQGSVVRTSVGAFAKRQMFRSSC